MPNPNRALALGVPAADAPSAPSWTASSDSQRARAPAAPAGTSPEARPRGGTEMLRYTAYGALFGASFPAFATVFQALVVFRDASFGAAVARAQAMPLMWIIDTAPLFLGLAASLAGRRQDRILELEAARRRAFLGTASDLFTAAQTLLSTVSSFSSMTAETAASVRETTATMGQLGQTATQAALTAETVVGLAYRSEKCSEQGLSAVETSTTQMMSLADEVRGLAQKIEALNGRMRDILEIASVVSFIAERSQRLVESAGVEAEKAGPAAQGLNGLVAELRRHSEDARRAAAQVKTILADVHKAMLSAMTAAEVGSRRAEEGARVASGTGETIRTLATALRESSHAAKEIATVAQQQDHGIDQVLQAMNEIYLATQETMASTQQVAAEARALNDLASTLKSAVES